MGDAAQIPMGLQDSKYPFLLYHAHPQSASPQTRPLLHAHGAIGSGRITFNENFSSQISLPHVLTFALRRAKMMHEPSSKNEQFHY